MLSSGFQAFDPLLALGVSSGVLAAIAFLPYIADTLKGRTRPERASWLIWSVLSSLGLFSQILEGGGASLWFAASQVACSVFIFLLSIRYGAGDFLSRRNTVNFLLATGGLVAWYFTDTTVYALALAISIGALGGLPTIAKAYRHPRTETLSTWVVAAVSAAGAAVSVGTLEWVLIAYPVYLFALYGGIVLAILLGRRQVQPGIAVA